MNNEYTRQNIKRFKKQLHFFNWLSMQVDYCQACGRWGGLVASIFNAPFSPFEEPISIYLCEGCYENLTGEAQYSAVEHVDV